MAINATQTLDIAALAALNVDTQQAGELTQELNRIISLIQQVQQVNTDQVAPIAHPLEIEQVLRDDRVTEKDQRASLPPLAAKTEADLYLVPRVIA